MQTYIIYGLLFLTVVLVVEAASIFLRSRLSGDDVANRRMRMIEKTGDENIGMELVKASRTNSASAFITNIENALWAANLPVSLPFLGGVALIVGIVAASALMASGLPAPTALPLGVLLGLGATYMFVMHRARKRRALFEEQLIPSIDLISRGLQAGHPAAVALEIVAKEMPDPIGTNFGMAMDEISFGLDRDVAMRNIAERFPSADMSFFVSALEIQRETGGNLVEVLNNLTTMMRDRRAMHKKVKAISSEGRITAIVVGLMPIAMIAILTLMSPGYYTEAMVLPGFWMMVSLPFLMYIAGMFIIRKLINIRI